MAPGSWEFLGVTAMATDDFFRARLDSMIDMRHPLVVLATRLPWADIEAAIAPLLARKDRAGRVVEDVDLFGPTTTLAGAGLSNAGRPRIALRLMISLLYLKHAFNLSDEALVERWSENVVRQFFSGMACYEPRPPCDATQIGRFRRVLGEAGVEHFLKTTIEAAVSMKMVRKSEFERIIVDTTVQEKAIAHPVDSGLLETSASQGRQRCQAAWPGAEADVCQGRAKRCAAPSSVNARSWAQSCAMYSVG